MNVQTNFWNWKADNLSALKEHFLRENEKLFQAFCYEEFEFVQRKKN